MNIKKLTLNSPGYPRILKEFTDVKPPDVLYHLGRPLNELLKRPAVAVVGTRQSTPYGERITEELAGQLAGQGIVIISGLAYGIDATAHQAALEAGGLCIAVLPSPLDNIVPVYNREIAQRILESGGALVSEYPPGLIPQKQNFIARNRIMSGLANAVLVTEAGLKSGTSHTTGYALQQGKTVMAVPGDIYRPGSAGTNNLIKSGALVVTELDDILHELGIHGHKTNIKKVEGRNQNEQAILNLMLEGVSKGEQLLEQSGLDVRQFNQTLTMLEIACKIRPLGGNEWTIY